MSKCICVNIRRCIFKCTSAQRYIKVNIYMWVGPLWIAASEQYAYQTNFWQVTRVSKMSSNGKKKCYKEHKSFLCDPKRPHLVLIDLRKVIEVVQFYAAGVVFCEYKGKCFLLWNDCPHQMCSLNELLN